MIMNKEKLAHIFSNIFNAYLSLLATYFIALYIDSQKIPNAFAIAILIIVMFGIEVFLFKYFGLISDLEISNRKQRPLLNLASVIPTLVIIFIAMTTSSPLFFAVSLIIFTSNLILGVVSVFWKLSGHMFYLSIFATLTSIIFFSWYLILFWLVILILVAWSRVQLKRHTISQVIAGTLCGVILSLLFL